MKILLLLLLVACVVADNYAVLVAGSKTWYNYRHQSDICHAYQLVHKMGGIPAANIRVMAYDDIANNVKNPIKGNLINKPNGPNVYKGCKIDYKGTECTAKKFLEVLRRLPSTAEDNVFIYYSDHGGVGLVAMPEGSPLYEKQLTAALEEMAVLKKFKQMVVYIEACESGSMFRKLRPHLNIFGTSASRANESSYAWYYDKLRKVYLGDEYSVKWMENSEASWQQKESLETQFTYLVRAVTKSHPQQYGDMSFDNEPIQDFQSEQGQFHRPDFDVTPGNNTEFPPADSRDVKLMSIKMALSLTNDEHERAELTKELEEEEQHRKLTDMHFQNIAMQTSGMNNVKKFLTSYTPPENFDCLEASYNAYSHDCLKGQQFSDYALKYVRTLVNLCEAYPTDRVLDAIHGVCLK